MLVDGAEPTTAAGGGFSDLTLNRGFTIQWVLTAVAPGSHLFTFDLQPADLDFDAVDISMMLEELPRPNAHNGTS
jgi:hypothetical protein